MTTTSRVAAALALSLALGGCPERATPPRGVRLTFEKPPHAVDVRATADRRLAQLSLKAQLHEDARTLEVRVPPESDVGLVKAVLGRKARLRFCAPDAETARRWCDEPPLAGVPVEPDDVGCRLASASVEGLAGAIDDAGLPAVVAADGARALGLAVEPGCLEVRIVAAAPSPSPAGGEAVTLQFDRRGAADFGALTSRLLGQRLSVVLDDVALVRPVVEAPITSGKLMVLLSAGEPPGAARVLAAALVGGPLPGLALQSEAPFGPPSLR